MAMKSPALDSLLSEFQADAQAASHDRWFRAQVQAALDDPRPSVPHDKTMARVRKTIEAARRKQKSA